jgi:Na+/H+ antiporter NhaD/arsenite permease-like protein
MLRIAKTPHLGRCGILAILVLLLVAPSALGASAAAGGQGHDISLAWSLPFVLLLVAIALMPFIHKHWWEKNYPWVAVGLGLVVAIYYWFFAPSARHWVDEMKEYVSFIALLGSLYVISGGIAIRVNRRATASANTALLLIGALVANVFGTTGASMLLIRPYLRMNRGHLKPFHIVFFIFIVSNCGGSLTPIGDPPLFLGYLKGIPFWWTVEHLWPIWAVTVGALLAVFFVIDLWDHRRQERPHTDEAGPQVHILGIQNFIFICVVIFAVFQDGFFEALHMARGHGLTAGALAKVLFCREVLMIGAAVAAKRLTGRVVYQANDFTYGPIREVAILFLGIFSTMVPALQWLNHNASKVGVHTPGQFYFATGGLSSMLDNAPTYLTFLQTRLGELEEPKKHPGDVDKAEVDLAMSELQRMLEVRTTEIRPGLPSNVRLALLEYVADHGEQFRRNLPVTPETREQVKLAFLTGVPMQNAFIVAISVGAVLFGAMTYIGNGPNFMVKSIAESAGARTPSFLGYLLRYALPILLPLYVLVWLLFFAGWHL